MFSFIHKNSLLNSAKLLALLKLKRGDLLLYLA